MPPAVVSPRITDIAASGSGIDAAGNGNLGVGRTVIFTVTTSAPIFVAGGTPALILNDGGLATYAGGSGSDTLTFSTSVTPGQNTPALEVASFEANGATVADAAGNAIDPASLATAAQPAGRLDVDTTPPVAASPVLVVAPTATATPIGIAAPTDETTATANLAIAVGTLPTDGTVTLADGVTRVTAGETLTVDQLIGLAFTPTPGAFAQSSGLTYSVTDEAGNASDGTATLMVEAAVAPSPTGIEPLAPSVAAPVIITTPNPYISDPDDSISVDDAVAYDGRGTFGLTGDVSSSVGVKGVEFTAYTNGQPDQPVDLGAATVNADGTFDFTALIGPQLKGFITATETDSLGFQTQAAFRPALQGGADPHVDRYMVTPTDTTYTGSTYYAADGSHRITVAAPGQTVVSESSDTFLNGGAPETTFVFNPGYGRDIVRQFRVDGTDHDTINLSSSDFTSLAQVLRATHNSSGGAVITDPSTGDTIKIAGISKAQLFHNLADFTFHP